MSKAQWKQPALKQAEKKVADREQAIQEAKFWKEKCEALQDQNIFLTAERNDAKAKVSELRGRAGGYDYLRSLGVVVMADEPLHLQGEDMDKYIERRTWNSINTKYTNQLLKSMNMTKQAVAVSVLDAAADNLQKHIDEHIKFNMQGRYNIGSNTGIQSKEADTQDTGHYANILRYADWHGVRK